MTTSGLISDVEGTTALDANMLGFFFDKHYTIEFRHERMSKGSDMLRFLLPSHLGSGHDSNANAEKWKCFGWTGGQSVGGTEP